MNPQGSQLLNTSYFSNLTSSINSAQSCAHLQDLVAEAADSLSAMKSGITAELAALQPLLALLTPPSVNPAAIVTWIENLISGYLTPMARPTITYAAQLAEMEQQIASLTAAISSMSGQFPSCSVSMPGL